METLDVGVASGHDLTVEGQVSFDNFVVDGIAYVGTNTSGVWTSEGVPQAEADKLVADDDWVSFKPGQSYGNKVLTYAIAVAGMSVAGQTNNLRLTGQLTRTAATTAQGVSVYGVTGDAPTPGVTESVYIAATGAPLPVRVTRHTSNATATCDYSRWGQPLNLTAPANVVPVTSIPQ